MAMVLKMTLLSEEERNFHCMFILCLAIISLLIRILPWLFSCFLSHAGAFWGAFLAPLLAVLVLNAVLFVCNTVVLIQNVRRRASTKTESVNLKAIVRMGVGVFGIMCLFGLTWLFAILTFSTPGLRDTFQLLFTIFNSFQGAFIFFITCVLSSEAREGWKRLINYRKILPFSDIRQRLAFKTNTGSGTAVYLSPLTKVIKVLCQKQG